MSDEVRVRYALALSGILPPKAISFCKAETDQFICKN